LAAVALGDGSVQDGTRVLVRFGLGPSWAYGLQVTDKGLFVSTR
jgi:hypothetical protein